MAEIADLMINGDICEGCGCELAGEGGGFPRRCVGCGGNARDFDPDEDDSRDSDLDEVQP